MNSEQNVLFTESNTGISKRSLRRTSIGSPISFWLNLNSKDEDGNWYPSSKWFLKGSIVDRSHGGLELLTEYPLEVEQLILFEGCVDNQAGIVQWSSRVDENTFKVGVKLV